MAENQKNPQQAQKPAVEEKPVVEQKSKTAADLVQYLAETGAPFAKENKTREFLAANRKATAKEFLDFMVKERATEGTIRRSGKWIFGATWEPESAAQMQPLEEVKLLRQRVADLEAQLAEAKAHLAASRRLVNAYDADRERERTQRLISGARDYGVRDNTSSPQQHGITQKSG